MQLFQLAHLQLYFIFLLRQRSHRFTIPNTGLDKILDITVSVVFQGVFGPRGYRLGRLAVQLYRIPSESEDHSVGVQRTQSTETRPLNA